MREVAIKIDNLKKQYRLGAIGGTTLSAELQSWWARKRGKEDPNLKIGEHYANGKETFYALDGINVEIYKGETVGIIGANGAGKSTLLKILSRVTAPTEGEVWINGKISSMLEVGTGFHQELTGRENIYMNGAILGMSKKEVDEKMESIIDFSECRQFIDTPVKRYSSGMYVKLAFAVASHLDSDILIMDEVLAVGDMAFQKKCLGKMGDVAETDGRTVLYVSHNMATIRNLCSRCIVLEKGRVIFDGETEKAIEIYNNAYFSDYSKVYYEFENEKRRSGLGTSERIHSIRLLHDTAIFDGTEKIAMSIEWSNKKALEDLHIRVVIKQADTITVGMTESSVLQQAYLLGVHNTQVYCDISMLTEGNYIMIISLNSIHASGGYEMRDESPIAIPFSINEDHYQKRGKSRWIKKYWGSVRFSELEVNYEE